jgi:hypothetical protein
MKTVKTIELSIDDARKLLVDFIYNALVNDPNHLKELISDEGFNPFYGPVNKMEPAEVADKVGELNLAEVIAHEHGADIVTVRLDSITAAVVYDENDPGCNGPDVLRKQEVAA